MGHPSPCFGAGCRFEDPQDEDGEEAHGSNYERDVARGATVNRPLGGSFREKGLAQAPLDHVEDGFEAPGDLEFLEDTIQMALDRLLADREGLGDLLIRAARGEEPQNLPFPFSQPILLPRLGVFGFEIRGGLSLQQLGDEPPLDL